MFSRSFFHEERRAGSGTFCLEAVKITQCTFIENVNKVEFKVLLLHGPSQNDSCQKNTLKQTVRKVELKAFLLHGLRIATFGNDQSSPAAAAGKVSNPIRGHTHAVLTKTNRV